MSNSDYKKTRTNLNDYLPEVNKSKVIRTINENLLNRYLSKVEYSHVDGIIGLADTTNATPQINERSVFDQNYQLQPVVYNKFGTVDNFMSFKDFMKRLERLGVDISKFDEWGSSLQFNWIPPVDFDKLVNYHDYYWDSSLYDDIPQYVTVKNQCTWAASRYKQVKKSATNASINYSVFSVNEASDILTISGNRVSDFSSGETIITYDSNGAYNLYKVVSATFNTASLKTDLVVDDSVSTDIVSFAKTMLRIKSVDILNNKITLDGNLHLLLTDGYVFSTVGSATKPTTYWEVESSEYSADTATTIVTVKQNISNLFDWPRISILPNVELSKAESTAVCTDRLSIDPITTWSDSRVGDLIWVKDYTVVSIQNTGSTIIGTNTFLAGTTLSGVNPGDILVVYYDSGETIDYPIVTVNPTAVILNSSVKFFNNTNLTYKIVRRIPFDSLKLSVAPTDPITGQFWVDTASDELKQWNGSTWLTLQARFSVLYSTVNGRHTVNMIQDNEWVEQNKWIHRNEITNFTGKTRAQIPIVEFYPYLEYSSTSYSDKQWQYRKDSVSNYTQVEVEPGLFELLDIRYDSVLSPAFTFQTSSIILFNEKYGNLTADLVPGTKIVLDGFANNNGVYEVALAEYIQMTSTSRFITRVYLTAPVTNPFDSPQNATIYPQYTKMGDLYLGVAEGQWMFEGIKSITPSSVNPTKNPMLDITNSVGANVSVSWLSSTFYNVGDTVSSGDSNYICTQAGTSGTTPPSGVGIFIDNGTAWAFVSTKYEYLLGPIWQEFKFDITDTVTAPLILLDRTLHDLALYEDYQEGDIRVYKNGTRQYGTFVEIRSTVDPNYVGGIQFKDSETFSRFDVIRIELGEYALSDIGKRAVNILTATGRELYNLATVRKVEQQKTESIQYPEFCVYDVEGNPLTSASKILTFKESEDNDINLQVLRRIEYDATTRDYTFETHLLGPSNELYLYKDFTQVDNLLQSIWKKGSNNEQYVPKKLSDGEWELPNQWYYNMNHENRKEVTLSQLFRHFKTIIDAQNTPSVFSIVGSSLFYLDDNVNYGLGGTIKEHNNGMDMLASVMFINNVNPLSLIQFAHDQYVNNLKSIQERISAEAATLLNYNPLNSPILNNASLIDYVTESVKDWFETNDKLDQWFGDSTTYDEATDTGVKNWIATIPYMNLRPKYQPYYIYDEILDIVQVVHHDGHRSTVSYNKAVKEQIYSKLKTSAIVGEQNVTSNAAPFPLLINGNAASNGDYLIRTNTTDRTRKLYRYSNEGLWEELNLDVLLAEVIVAFEQALFDNLPGTTSVNQHVSNYDLDVLATNSRYPSLIEEQFSNFVKGLDIEAPFSSAAIFKSNNPFTWNYAYTPVPVHPETGLVFNDVAASWQALYKNVYGTSYPHLEPWVLQGYVEKPTWWDAQYRDTTNTRRWKASMWNNIFSGIVPAGRPTPDGSFGIGMGGQISPVFNFVSVNVGATSTTDGVPPDGLLPPFWDTSNTSNSRVRSLYDPKLQQFIITPQANYLFDQGGPVEWEWKTSAQRMYDDLIAAFKIDPMRFIYFTFGIDFINVNCLQVDKDIQKVFSHKDTVFHGDFIKDTNTIYKANGLNQWYVHFNRYNGYDDVNSGFKTSWIDWDVRLSYMFQSFIDTPSFFISSDIFDLTNRDYEILMKKTHGIDDKWIDAIQSTVLNVPSQYAPSRAYGSGWTVQFDNTSPIGRNLQYYAPEDYEFRALPLTQNPFTADTFRIYSYTVADAGVEDVYGYQIVSYNQSLMGVMPTELNDSSFQYWFQISIDGGAYETISIRGEDAQTFVDLIAQLNSVLDGQATASVQNGNIVIRSNTNGPMSSISVIDDGLFVSANPSLFNNISAQLTTSINFLNYFVVDGNQTNIFTKDSIAVVSGSTNYNGSYTVVNSVFDTIKEHTIITVDETVSISDLIIDGIIEPGTSKTLPDTWIDGTEVYLNSAGILPSGLDETIAYYVVRVNDREFKLASSYEAAIARKAITVKSAGTGSAFVGRVQSTFTVNSSNTQTAWRRHFSDKRYLESAPTPHIISGIQNMIDFIKGYEDYTEDLGFTCNSSEGENVDPATGRMNTWLYEVEKFIDGLFKIRTVKTAASQEYSITAVSAGSYFELNNNHTVNWQVGTQVVLSHGLNSQLPTEFNNPLMGFVPYYVIPAFQKNKFQLAVSLSDAKVGNAIKFTGNGFGELFATVYKSVQNFPTLELNPFKNYIWVKHPLGILSNVFSSSSSDILTNQRIYDNNGVELSVKDILVLREDTKSRISLTIYQQEQNDKVIKNKKYMQGMHVFFDGYENILMFGDYASDGTLIYDSFLGLNTPRFYMSFNRQHTFTLRPNVGGFVLSGNDQVQNFEAAVDNLRNLYDVYNRNAERKSTDILRRSFGYDGPKEYMNSLKINERSQFVFWQGMIQNKGTNFAANAFTNQKTFGDLIIDEFWAYKLATFGDSKEKSVLELRLRTSDVNNKELRLEFVLPDSTALDDTFNSIRLTDMSRWWNQPDQFLKLSPISTFYFSSITTTMITDVMSRIRSINGKTTLPLGETADGVIITYYDAATLTRKEFKHNSDYTYLNNKAIIFNYTPSEMAEFDDILVYILTYNYDAQNPARIIDKKSGTVVANVPVWNPARGQYYYNAIRAVDIKNSTDPAEYTNSPDGNVSDAFWNTPEVGTVWFDDYAEGYFPYQDTTIYPAIDDRLAKWGLLAEWADVKLYEWTESDIHPDEWNSKVAQQANDTQLSSEEKKTGQAFTRVYKIIDGNYVEQRDQHFDVVAGLISVTPITLTFNSTANNIVNIFTNGVFTTTLNLGIGSSASNALINYISNVEPHNYIHVVLPVVTPTQEQLDSGEYKISTPYTVITRINKDTTKPYSVYYFWVANKTNKKLFKNQITIYEAERLLKNMTDPYMIITGFRDANFGYGLTYGHVFDESAYEVPHRFSQAVVRGLSGLVTDENRFALQFTRNFTLRDKLPSGQMLNDVHTEWKLFREKQLSKVDSYLWNKLTEALVGMKLILANQFNAAVPVPSLDRILYDDLYQADTRYGLGEGQVFTDATLSLKTITSILKDPNVEFGNIDIDLFLQRHPFETKSDIIEAMQEIYDNFPIETINYIYFQTLHDAFSLKKEFSEIFKTSWVAIQIAQNVVTPTNVPIAQYTLDDNGPCFLGLPSDVDFTFNPLIEYTLFVSSDGSISYVSFDGTDLKVIRQETPTRQYGEGQITAVWTDETYVYLLSANGGLDIYSFNGTNFVLLAGIATDGAGINISGYNPILTVSESGDGLGVYEFDGESVSKADTSSDHSITNVRDVTVHNGYIITCGEGRLDAWLYQGGSLQLVSSLTTLVGGNEITKIISDGTFLYTGSNNNVKIQVFTFNGVFNQVYTDSVLNSGPTVAVGNGYFFTSGMDIRAYEFDGSSLGLVDIAEVGPNSASITFSEESYRLYVGDVGVFSFLNNKFEKLHKEPLVKNTCKASIVIGTSLLTPPLVAVE